jgi:hypothetical protein
MLSVFRKKDHLPGFHGGFHPSLSSSSVCLPTLIPLTPVRPSPEDARNPIGGETAVVRFCLAMVRRLFVEGTKRVHDVVKRHRPGARRGHPKRWS